MIKQLNNMRHRLNANADQIEEFFKENPFTIIRGPETLEETRNLILSKLFTKGASEALRRTSPAIYIGRLSAFKTAKAWTSPFQNQECFDLESNKIIHRESFTKATYSEFLKSSLEKAKEKNINVMELFDVIYPQRTSFEVLGHFVGQFGATKSNSKRYSQAVRTWTVNNFNYEYTSSLKSILETSFGQSHHSSAEDVNEFRKLMGMKLTSLQQVVEECKEKNLRPLDMFYYMTKLYKSSKVSRIQAFGNGPSTSGLHMTSLSLKKYNHIPGMVSIMDVGIDETQLELESSMSLKLDKIKLYYNLLVMSKSGMFTLASDLKYSINGIDLSTDCLTIIRSIKSLAGFDNVTKKTLKFVACDLLSSKELSEKLVAWRTLNYNYLRRQRKTFTSNGTPQWSGDLSVLVSSEDECFTLNERNGSRFIETKSVKDIGSLYRALTDMCKTLGFEIQSFFSRGTMNPGDIYLSQTNKMLHRSDVRIESKSILKVRYNQDFKYKRLNDLETFKVINLRNEKTNELTIHLEDRGYRTATICHSNGNFYPVEIPQGFKADDSIFYMGVRLDKLLSNRSWFYNFRLPSMAQENLLIFLKQDVILNDVMNLEDKSIQKIHEYMEVRQEINEEAFSLTQDYSNYMTIKSTEFENMDSFTLNELFRKTIETVDMPDELKTFDYNIESWADEVENELNETQNIFEDEEENYVGVVKAFGYKKPSQRRAMITISSLQQGGMLKRRILDCFFTSQDIRNEKRKQLPHMYLWLMSLKNDGLESTIESLKKHIIRTLAEGLAISQSKVLNIMSSSPDQYKIPIGTLHNYISGITEQQHDMFETMLREAEAEEDDEFASDSELSIVD